MFRRERHMKKKVFFLLIMDNRKYIWDIPEETLWLTFEEALDAGKKALYKSGKSFSELGFTEEEVEIDREKQMAFIPHVFEIMPISVSTEDNITWLGKKRKQ